MLQTVFLFALMVTLVSSASERQIFAKPNLKDCITSKILTVGFVSSINDITHTVHMSQGIAEIRHFRNIH